MAAEQLLEVRLEEFVKRLRDISTTITESIAEVQGGLDLGALSDMQNSATLITSIANGLQALLDGEGDVMVQVPDGR